MFRCSTSRNDKRKKEREFNYLFLMTAGFSLQLYCNYCCSCLLSMACGVSFFLSFFFVLQMFFRMYFLVESVYPVFTRMPGESYRRRLRSVLYLCYVFREKKRVSIFTRLPGESYRRRLTSLLLYLCYVLKNNNIYMQSCVTRSKHTKRTLILDLTIL